MAKGGRTPTNDPTLIATKERRAYVLDLRKAGADYRSIAAAAIRKFGLEKLPSGWDCRYAFKDVQRELDKIGREMAIDVEAVRTLELERLDDLLRSIWPMTQSHIRTVRDKDGQEVSVVTPNPSQFQAIDRTLRIMERRAALIPDLTAAQSLDLNLGGSALEITERVIELTHGADEEPDYDAIRKEWEEAGEEWESENPDPSSPPEYLED